MAKETKAYKNYKKKLMAGDKVARAAISKFKAKDRKKAEKKQKIEKQAKDDELVQLTRQKQVDDFVGQAKQSKGKGYEKMSVDDFFSLGFEEESDDDDAKTTTKTTKTTSTTTQKGIKVAPTSKSTKITTTTTKPTTKAKMAVPLPTRIIPIKTQKGTIMQVPLDDEEDDEDHMSFSDDEDDDNSRDFYEDDIDNQDEQQYESLEVNGIPGDESSDFDYDEDDLYASDEDNDEQLQHGGFFERKKDGMNDDDDTNDDKAYTQASHKEELAKLQQKDPELYKYLLQTDPSMLEFDQSDTDNDESDSANDNVSTATIKKQQKRPLNIETLTSEKFDSIKSKFDNRKYTARDLLLVIRLFKSAVVVRKKAYLLQNKAKKQGKNVSARQSEKVDVKLIMLTSSPLYQHFLQFALKVIPCALVELLYINNNIPIPFLQDGTQDLSSRKPDQGITWRELGIALSDGISPLQGKLTSLVGWTKVATLCRTYFLTVFTLLKDSVDSGLIRLVLRSILPAIPLLENISIPTPLLLRRVLHFWCYTTDVNYGAKDTTKTSTSSFKTDNVSRIEAFLVLRRLSLCLPHSSHVKEAVMKGVYQNFAKVASHVTSYSWPTIVFLTNCVVELYGIDGVLAYQLCFVYLRQLATQLRGYLLTPTSKGLRSIYNWQFINCLRIWGQILATYAIEPNSALRPLIYPYSQICTTILTLSSAPAFFPVKVQVSELLAELMYKCQVFIPTATHLLNILRHPCFSKKKHTTVTKHQSHLEKELTYKLHISEGLLDSLQYKESIAGRTLDVLTYHLSIIADSVFFPEYSYPIRTTIKQLLTMIQIPSISKDLRQLQTAINETVHYVLERRSKSAFSPRDVVTKQVNSLTLMTNTVALNALHNAAGGSGTVGVYKPTSLHKLHDKRKHNKENQMANEYMLRQQQMIDDLGEPDDTDDDGYGSNDDDYDDEVAEQQSKLKKRKSLSHRDDYDEDDSDLDDMFDDNGEGDDFDGFDGEGDDIVDEFDLLDDSD